MRTMRAGDRMRAASSVLSQGTGRVRFAVNCKVSQFCLPSEISVAPVLIPLEQLGNRGAGFFGHNAESIDR